MGGPVGERAEGVQALGREAGGDRPATGRVRGAVGADDDGIEGGRLRARVGLGVAEHGADLGVAGHDHAPVVEPPHRAGRRGGAARAPDAGGRAPRPAPGVARGLAAAQTLGHGDVAAARVGEDPRHHGVRPDRDEQPGAGEGAGQRLGEAERPRDHPRPERAVEPRVGRKLPPADRRVQWDPRWLRVEHGELAGHPVEVVVAPRGVVGPLGRVLAPERRVLGQVGPGRVRVAGVALDHRELGGDRPADDQPDRRPAAQPPCRVHVDRDLEEAGGTALLDRGDDRGEDRRGLDAGQRPGRVRRADLAEAQAGHGVGPHPGGRPHVEQREVGHAHQHDVLLAVDQRRAGRRREVRQGIEPGAGDDHRRRLLDALAQRRVARVELGPEPGPSAAPAGEGEDEASGGPAATDRGASWTQDPDRGHPANVRGARRRRRATRRRRGGRRGR